MERDVLRGIIAEIEKELDALNELKAEMRDIVPGESLIAKRSAGSILHDFYNCCERIFKRIAIEVNGGYEDAKAWHKALLFKMTIPIKGLRPAVISEELAAELDEYLSFRHVFRHIYGFELKGERIGYLAEKFDRVANRVIQEIKEFLGFLYKELEGVL